MSRIRLSEDIRSVAELKRNTRDILDHLHATGRPVILTVNGKADSVLLDVHVYEKKLHAGNLARLLVSVEQDAAGGRTRPARAFLKEFKHAKKIHR
jgi:prevent-host-death family protein